MTVRVLPTPLPRADINAICARLGSGEVLLLPTDTVYGLCCDPRNQSAVDRVFRIKGRDRDVPLAVLVSGRQQVDQLLAPDSRLDAMDDGSWPSTLTAVMARRPGVVLASGLGGSKVGIRRPSGGLITAVVESFGPVASTSANKHGHRAGVDVASIVRNLQNAERSIDVDAFVDGGTCNAQVSTVVDVLDRGWVMLRPGALGAAGVADILGHQVTDV